MSDMILVTDPTQELLWPGGCICSDSTSRPMLDTRREYPTGHHLYLCGNCLRALLHAVDHAPMQDLVDANRRLGDRQAELEQTRNELTAAKVDLERSEHDFGLAREQAAMLGANLAAVEEKLRAALAPPEAISREQFLADLATAEAGKES
jgi:hypothetical protein